MGRPGVHLRPREPLDRLRRGRHGRCNQTDDGGQTWSRISGLGNATVTALSIDPDQTETIYVGTYEDGVLLSTDGGTSWNPFNEGHARRVNSLAIDTTSRTLFSGTARGVFACTLPD